MNKKNSKFFYIVGFFCSLLTANIVLSKEAQKQNTKVISQDLENEREYLEQVMTEVRKQTEQISFCLQQMLQSLQANKISGSKREVQSLGQEILDIQGFIQMLLDKVLIQTKHDAIQIGLILNSIIAKYLIKHITENPFAINAEKLNTLIDKQLQTRIEKLQGNQIPLTVKQNNQMIDILQKRTDSFGLTWYNHLFRFLKRSNAYSYARFGTIAGLTALAGVCIYKRYNTTGSNNPKTDNDWFNWLGDPGKFVLDSKGDVQLDKSSGKPLKTSGTGVYKVWDAATSSKELGIIAIAPVATIPLDYIFNTLYFQYWRKIKAEIAKRWKRFDEICSGTDKKYDAYDAEKVYFKDMTGAEHLEALAKKITNFMKYPERYERSQIEEHRGILLYGPPQTGKTLFAKALRTMIAHNLGSDKKISFIDAKKILDIDAKATIDEIFDYAKHVAPAIIFIDEIDLVGAHREKNPVTTGQLLTCMQGVDMVSKQIIVIGATNKPEQLDKALLVDGRFGKVIHVDYPNYQERKSYLEQQLAKRCLSVEPALIEYIAQETEGASYNKLRRVIMETLILSAIELRPITAEDFEETLDSEVRKIKKLHAPIPEKEKKVIATYQAGKALARHLLKTDKEVVKITTHPVSKNVKTNEHGWAIKTDNDSDAQNDKFKEEEKEQKMKDGEVFTKTSTTNDTLLADAELEKEALSLLAGGIAQKVVFGSPFTKCNPQDRAEAMKIIYTIVSQGEKIDKIIKAEALKVKAKYEQQLEEMFIANKSILEEITSKLVQQDTINRHEWATLISNTNL